MSDAFAPDSPAAARVVPSPNHDERAESRRPDILLLHYTGMSDENEALLWLTVPPSRVSAHYLVFEDGGIVQMVPEARRAWHAGVSSWGGVADVNSRSIGIEIANPGHEGGLPPYPAMQIERVIALCHDIVRRHGIRPDLVLAHSDVAPTRKEDPGELFPWQELHDAGVGHWVEPAPLADGPVLAPGDGGSAVAGLQTSFVAYGYGLPISGVFDEATAAVVRAFQRHFRPGRVDGLGDLSTRETLRNLLARRPTQARD
ncbi:MAG TPA: N-acetylmuramoyl-L-alanine amidase [Beijerinckiaceae bacterium]|nr:N-acetylmuramoyl-L-alanine amidase [Beijerinckiaceae bacterium]